MNETTTPWWRNPSKLPFAVLLAFAAYFLWTEHRGHVIELLPWVLILGCIGVHLFMHGKHGHGGGHSHGGDADTGQRDSDEGGNKR